MKLFIHRFSFAAFVCCFLLLIANNPAFAQKNSDNNEQKKLVKANSKTGNCDVSWRMFLVPRSSLQ